MATRASRIHPANFRASLCFDVAVTTRSAVGIAHSVGRNARQSTARTMGRHCDGDDSIY